MMVTFLWVAAEISMAPSSGPWAYYVQAMKDLSHP